MDVELIPARELSAEHRRRWERIRAEQPHLASPYLSAGFTRAVARVREDVWVGVLSQGGRIRGYFPHQRAAAGAGLPVAAGVNDVQGPVTAPDLEWSCEELLRGCRLRSWRFDHLVTAIRPLRRWHRRTVGSPFIDLEGGFEGYLEARRRAGSSAGRKIAAQARRLERDLGPLRFVAAESEPRLLDTLLRWKTRQLESRRRPHRLRRGWVRQLFARLHAEDGELLDGVLSTLHAGDRLLAIQLGLRARAPAGGCWHYWIPAFDRRFARYSPGLVLLLSIVRCAAESGLAKVDLGLGPAPYKLRLATGCQPLARGVARRSGGAARLPRPATA